MEKLEFYIHKGILVKMPGIENLVSNFLKKARTNLITMSILLETKRKEIKDLLNIPGDYSPNEWVINTAYYSMYLAALAALAKIGYKSKNHTATIYALETFFVKKGLLEKEGLNGEIKEKLELSKLVEFVQNFFADYKSVKYGFEKDMHRFFLEKISRKIYKHKKLSKEEYLEFYSFYLIFKKIGKEGEIKSLLGTVKVKGLTRLLREFEKLNYPYFFGDRELKKEWINVFGT